MEQVVELLVSDVQFRLSRGLDGGRQFAHSIQLDLNAGNFFLLLRQLVDQLLHNVGQVLLVGLKESVLLLDLFWIDKKRVQNLIRTFSLAI